MRFKRDDKVKVINSDINGIVLSGDSVRKEYLILMNVIIANEYTWVFKEDELRPA